MPVCQRKVMCEKTRIDYALSIKQWCDAHPGATDLDLINFLQRVEQTIRDQVIKQSQRWEKGNDFRRMVE